MFFPDLQHLVGYLMYADGMMKKYTPITWTKAWTSFAVSWIGWEELTCWWLTSGKSPIRHWQSPDQNTDPDQPQCNYQKDYIPSSIWQVHSLEPSHSPVNSSTEPLAFQPLSNRSDGKSLWPPLLLAISVYHGFMAAYKENSNLALSQFLFSQCISSSKILLQHWFFRAGPLPGTYFPHFKMFSFHSLIGFICNNKMQ